MVAGSQLRRFVQYDRDRRRRGALGELLHVGLLTEQNLKKGTPRQNLSHFPG